MKKVKSKRARKKFAHVFKFFSREFAVTAEHAGEYKVIAKNEGGEAVSCADLRVVQPLADIGTNLLPSFTSNDDCDKVNVVSFFANIIIRF